MKKIQLEYIKNQYRSGLNSYVDLTKEVGLWESEKYVFQKYPLILHLQILFTIDRL